MQEFIHTVDNKDMCLDICFAALARPLVLGLVVDDVLFTPKVKR